MFHAASISKILRYRTGSISNVTTFDIDVYQIVSIRYRIPNIRYPSRVVISYPDIEGHLPTSGFKGHCDSSISKVPLQVAISG
jgi:hypothetical protein